MAVYLGECDEEKINNMTIPFFNDILQALGRRVNYDAVSNFAGNAFAKDAWKMIQEANPLTKPQKMNSGFVDMLSGLKVTKAQNIDDIDWSKV